MRIRPAIWEQTVISWHLAFFTYCLNTINQAAAESGKSTAISAFCHFCSNCRAVKVLQFRRGVIFAVIAGQ